MSKKCSVIQTLRYVFFYKHLYHPFRISEHFFEKRYKSGRAVKAFHDRFDLDDCVICRFSQLELLQGARDEREWDLLNDYLSTQYYLEASEDTWRQAARIYFELRRKGITINGPIDCCIAQIAMEHGAVLLYQDQESIRIARVRPPEQEQFKVT